MFNRTQERLTWARAAQCEGVSTSQAPGPYAMSALIAFFALGRASFLVPAAAGRDNHAPATTHDKTRACPKLAPLHAGFSEVSPLSGPPSTYNCIHMTSGV